MDTASDKADLLCQQLYWKRDKLIELKLNVFRWASE